MSIQELDRILVEIFEGDVAAIAGFERALGDYIEDSEGRSWE